MPLKDDPVAYAIVGCAMRVHSVLGNGFLESAYGDALEIEFRKSGIPFEREGEIRVIYEGQPLATRYRADFLCDSGKCIVELKAVRRITNVEWAQTLHYLRATEAESAVLINFGAERLQYDYFNKGALAARKQTPMSGMASLTLRPFEDSLAPEDTDSERSKEGMASGGATSLRAKLPKKPGALAKGSVSSEF
jgi:GxxExxY protein